MTHRLEAVATAAWAMIAVTAVSTTALAQMAAPVAKSAVAPVAKSAVAPVAKPAATAPKPAAKAASSELRTGKSLMPTPVFSEEEDRRVLKLFEGLRVADVQDGMDAAGLHNVGLMDADVRPLWKDTTHFTHRFTGIAITARYVPTNRQQAPRAGEAYDPWADRWYAQHSGEPYMDLMRPGSALVIDDASNADVGSIGSNNIMMWKTRGMVGVVTDATARDTDEIIAQKVPLYFRRPGRGIRPGRNELESVNRPIVCGGVLVIPGDVVVADGDGVVVVPRAQAEAVARYARAILEKDKKSRRVLYQKLGLPQDDSVR